MRKLSLTFPGEITEELSLLCGERPKLCKKEGAMGWVSNDRVIIVRRGYFQYYNIHPSFVENDPQSIRDKYFKGAIRLDLIHQANYLPKNKIRKNFLELIFPKSRICLRVPTETAHEDEEGIERRGSGEDLEKWIFEFKIDVKEWVQQRREEFMEQKRKMTKIEANQPKDIVKSESVYSLSIPESAQVREEDNLERNIQEYVEAIQRTKQFLRTKAEVAEEEAARQRKKKEKEMAELLSTKNQRVEEAYSISIFWREYFRVFEQLIVEKEKHSLETVLEREMNMLKTIEYFNSSVINVVQDYVDERTIGWDGAKKQMEGFRYYQGIWLRVGGKQLNQQFLVNYYLNDIFYSMREVKRLKFRLPLMSLVKYKGLKILAMCDMPFSQLEKTEIYNLTEEGFDLQLMGKLKEGLEVIEDVLNVKSQIIELDSKKKITAPLGLGLKIYEYNFNKENPQDQAILPNFYYLINPGIIFPLDFNGQSSSIQPLARLRPELVAAYRDYHVGTDSQLSSQAFMKSSMPQEFKKFEEEKVLKACRWLQRGKIKQLADKLNDLQLMMVDSYSIKKMMEQIGINIRHLHIISDYSLLPYIRQHCLADALARTIKKEFRSALKEMEGEELAKQSDYIRMKNSERVRLVRERKAEGQQKYRQLAVDYLNLIFGCGLETEEFWKIIILKCKQYFRLDAQYPINIKPGLLLHSVLWHCSLKASFDREVPLFKTKYPFSESSQVDFKISLKTYDYPSFEIQKLFRGAPSIQDRISDNVFEESTAKLLKLQILFYNTIRFSFQGSVALSKLSNHGQYLARAEMQTPLHPALIPYYLMNKSEHNFRKALELIEFSLPDSHPLLVTLHAQYSKLFEPELMKKTGLMLAVRNLGEFHPKTTELYSKLYHEGENEYIFKARRIKSIEQIQQLCHEMFMDQKYDSCLNYVLEQMAHMNEHGSSHKLGTGNYRAYLAMLMEGLESAVKILDFTRGLQVSEEISVVMSSFKLKDSSLTYHLLKNVLTIHMLLSPKKYFLYKMVLLTVHIRQRHEETQLDGQGCLIPVPAQIRQQLLEGLSFQYSDYESHSKWIGFVLAILVRSFQYFNYLEDLFNNYGKHIRKYNSEAFRECLGLWDIFIRVYGQAFFKGTLYDVRFN